VPRGKALAIPELLSEVKVCAVEIELCRFNVRSTASDVHFKVK
jgi:hypothetical protein